MCRPTATWLPPPVSEQRTCPRLSTAATPVAHVSPKVLPDDDELTLFWRAVQSSAGVYAELLQRLAAGERFGQTQPHKGRLYQVKQRGLTQERVVDQRLAQGMLAGSRLDPRVTWFFADAAPQNPTAPDQLSVEIAN